MKQEALLHQAVILAGGMGSRLAPITDTLPKPLVPVAGVPVITGITSLLKKQGITPVAVTVCALPESFDQYKDPNLPLTMVKGKLPLGSGGSVKAIAHLLEDTFLVISGAKPRRQPSAQGRPCPNQFPRLAECKAPRKRRGKAPLPPRKSKR